MKVRKVLKSLFGRSSKSTFVRTYQSIDELPIYNWFKIFETKDLKYLVKKGNPPEKELNTLWSKLFDEYMSVFGLNEEFLEHFEQTKVITNLKIKYALEVNQNKRKKILFLLKFKVKKFGALNPTKKEADNFMNIVVSVENNIGRSIDDKTTSVRKFYTYLKQIENEPVKR